MRTYSVTKLPANKAFKIEGDFLPGSIPVNIPNDDPRKHNFISYFVRISDLDNGLAMANAISPHNSIIINRALFIAALADLIKCFEGSDKYTILSETKLEKFNPEAYTEYRRYKDLRNQHYMHVSSSMTEAFAYLLVAPEDSNFLFGGPPSVIVDSNDVNFLNERSCLIWVIAEIKKFAVTEFDKLADNLSNTYSSTSRDKLLSYGIVRPTVAAIDIEQK